MFTLNGLSGAGALMPAIVVAATFATPSLICIAAASGVRSRRRALRVISAGTVARSTSASPNSFAGPGSGLAIHGSAGGATGAGSGSVSNSTVVMSTPEMPSTSAWWVFAISAKRPRDIFSTSMISQSGFERSSRCENTRPARRFSAASSAGAGRAAWRMW